MNKHYKNIDIIEEKQYTYEKIFRLLKIYLYFKMYVCI